MAVLHPEATHPPGTVRAGLPVGPVLRSEDGKFPPFAGTYALDAEGRLVLTGQMGGRPVRAVLVKEKPYGQR